MTDELVERITVEGDRISVPLLVWRRFRQPMPGLVERIYDRIDNAHLAKLGPYLPLGTVVTIPIETPRPSTEERTTVRLW